MTQRRHALGLWLAPCALVGALLAADPRPARGADDPREWLERMNKALATRNYDGTFFHISGGRVETMRIVHRVRSGRVSERLQSLDGSGREFVRANGELTCYLPDQHTVLVEPRQDHGPFLGSLPQFDSTVSDFYRIEALPPAHILGRPAKVIAVNPKDQFRFGYRLWLDETTAMPLKTQLCDSRGQVIEQIFFARLDMPENIPDSDLAPTVHTDGMRWVRQGPSSRQCFGRIGGLPCQSAAPRFPPDRAGRPDIGRRVGARQPFGVLRRVGDGVGVRRRAKYLRRSCRGTGFPGPTAHAGTGPGRFRICVLHGRAGPPSDGSGRGPRANRGIHRALGQDL